jgi:iron complex transport system ATP-binding protein
MAVQMVNVSLVRDRQCILKDINWQVEPGENWAIVGLNGSGKTTLLNIINGYLWPSKGSVRILEKEFGRVDIWEIRRSIGWVSSSLQEKLYAHELAVNIVLSGKYASIGLYEQPHASDFLRANTLLEQIGCGQLGKRRYETLSQGEKQKILIARALMSRPKLLILDEPCTGLDIFSRDQFLKAIENLCQEKEVPNLLYVTHRIEEIMPVFPKALLLRKGEVHSLGNTTTVLTSENLSDFFGLPVEVKWRDRRPWMRIL